MNSVKRDLMIYDTIGCVAAAEAISHIGARLAIDLKELFADNNLM
jgi:hypothetical protein